jgi:hypothetical protein
MPTRPDPARPPHRQPPTPRRRPRLWAMLPAPARTQLAQQLAYLLQRVRGGEAQHADRDA